jgi:hypothetical protein
MSWKADHKQPEILNTKPVRLFHILKPWKAGKFKEPSVDIKEV